MALQKQGEFWYGDSGSDICELLARHYSQEYPATEFAEAVCDCGRRVFTVQIDEDYPEAAWICKECDAQFLFHTTAEAGPYEGDPEADAECCECPCTPRGASYFEVTVGAALYEGSRDVRWVYIGCRCVACGLTACYTDWNRVDLALEKVFARLRNRVEG
jgi:hypothetical protein